MAGKQVLVGIGVVVAAAAYVAGSWGLGQVAHARFDALEQELAKQPVPLVKVARRDYTGGVFSSVEIITFELNRELWGALTRPSQSGADDFQVDDEEALDDEQAAVLEKAAMQSLDESADASPLQVTVRHDVRHGPLPGFTSFGAARIKTTLVLSDDTRAELAKILGEREPLVVDTLVGFTGAGRTHASSPAFEIQEGDRRIAWQGIQGTFEYGRNFDSLRCDVLAPGAEGTFADAKVALGKIEMKCDLHRAFDELYAGTTNFIVESLRGGSTVSTASVDLEALIYDIDVRAQGDYVDMTMELGMAKLQVPNLDMSNVRYDITVNHVHGPAYSELIKKFREIGTPGNPALAPDPMAAMAPLMMLLEHSPQIVIKRIGFSIPEGEVGIAGTVQLKDFKKLNLQDPAAQLELIRKIDASADVWFDEGVLARDWWNGSVQEAQDGMPTSAERLAALRNQIAQLEQQGFLTRKEDRFESRIEFKAGVLTANGKPLGGAP